MENPARPLSRRTPTHADVESARGPGPYPYTWKAAYEQAALQVELQVFRKPPPEFLQGLDNESVEQVLAEIHKAWVGGYTSALRTSSSSSTVLDLPMRAIDPADTAMLDVLVRKACRFPDQALKALANNCLLIIGRRSVLLRGG